MEALSQARATAAPLTGIMTLPSPISQVVPSDQGRISALTSTITLSIQINGYNRRLDAGQRTIHPFQFSVPVHAWISKRQVQTESTLADTRVVVPSRPGVR